jgi:hypothetical protein
VPGEIYLKKYCKDKRNYFFLFAQSGKQRNIENFIFYQVNQISGDVIKTEA